MGERTCSECGGPVTGRKGTALVCSKRCKMRRDDRRRRVDLDRHAARLEAKQAYNRRVRAANRVERSCDVCGSRFLAIKPTARLCSSPCVAVAARLRNKGIAPHKRAIAARRLSTAARGRRRSGAPFVNGPCKVCGAWFTAYWPVACCSKHCSRKAADQRKAGRKAIRRVAIFERDLWRCGLCGKQTKRDAKAPHPKAPVVDHILPRAKGGSDDPANLQCAHFMCNSLKGERVWRDAEQLRLVS